MSRWSGALSWRRSSRFGIPLSGIPLWSGLRSDCACSSNSVHGYERPSSAAPRQVRQLDQALIPSFELIELRNKALEFLLEGGRTRCSASRGSFLSFRYPARAPGAVPPTALCPHFAVPATGPHREGGRQPL